MLRNVRKIGTKLAIFSNLNGYACWRTQIGDRVTDDLVVKNGKTRTCYDHQVFCRCRYFVLWEGWTSSECCMLAAGQSWAGFFGCPLAFIHGHGHEPRTQGRSPDIIYIYHPISISTVVISCFIQLRTGSCCTSPVTLDHPSTGQWGDTKMSLYRLSGTGLTDRYLKLLMNCSWCSDLLWMVGYKGNKVCSFGLRNVNYILVIS